MEVIRVIDLVVSQDRLKRLLVVSQKLGFLQEDDIKLFRKF